MHSKIQKVGLTKTHSPLLSAGAVVGIGELYKIIQYLLDENFCIFIFDRIVELLHYIYFLIFFNLVLGA